MSNKKNSDNKSNKKQNTKNMKINEWPRHGIQALWAFITKWLIMWWDFLSSSELWWED